MSLVYGFELLRAREISELQTKAELYRHRRTGAEVLSLSNSDENKVFGITFRTPPPDATGVAHILEHSVLCGSRKYPVKEPFVELLKGSLQTFLNAFTYPDRTCYPVASQNLQDFHNLIDVYLDAVFYPLLTPYTLMQEGWHLHLEEADGPLAYQGVVYSEMKGAYSSPDRVLAELSQQSLFPDHPYGRDAGGDPDHIPELTFERFKEFHRYYYHPSNSKIFFWGDDDPVERLRLLDSYLKDFDFQAVDSDVPLRPPFSVPRRLRRPVAVASAPAGGNRGLVTVNWVLGPSTEVVVNLSSRVIEYALLGMPGAPLRKALIDSGLGEDLAGVGLEDELRQLYFSTGLKGVEPANLERVEPLILQTMASLTATGIDPETLEAAINTVEFRLRENHSGSYPRGLLIMLRALSVWLYDGDPFALLAFEEPLAQVKATVAKDPGYVQTLVEKAFLHNNHRSTVILEPDPELAARRQRQEEERLARLRASLSSADVQRIIADTRELQRRQQQPDPPEALAAIPTLKVSDLEPTNKVIPLQVEEGKDFAVVFHDLPTSGILYLDLGFDLHLLEPQQLPYAPLFGRALLEMGTEKEDFVSLSRRISRFTGGIRPQIFSAQPKNSTGAATWLLLRAKAMQHRVPELVLLLQDILGAARLDDKERFRQILLEEKARCERRLVNEGHRVVGLRLQSHFSEAGWAAEQMKGASYFVFLQELIRSVEESWPQVHQTLEDVRTTLINRSAMLVNLTTTGDEWLQSRPQVTALLETLPAAPLRHPDWTAAASLPAAEGLTVPARVNFVGKGINLYQCGYDYHGSVHVICRYLRAGWLWDRIRVEGGAYGVFCFFDHLTGVLSLISYRDPGLERTLEIFDQAGRFLATLEMSPEQLERAIIGAIGEMDAYMLPDVKGYTSLVRHLTGQSEEERQQRRQEILTTKLDDFHRFGRLLAPLSSQGLVKVLGPPDVLSRHRDWLQVVSLL